MRENQHSWAILAILITVMALPAGDVIVRAFGAELGVWQVFVLRSAIVVPVLAGGMYVFAKDSLLRPQAVGWVILRSFMLVTCWLLYYVALVALPVSVAVSALYTIPLFMVLFSAWFSDDQVTIGGWIAVVLGFVSVLVILRPVEMEFDTMVLLPLAAAMLYAATMVMSRMKCRTANSLTIALFLHVAFIIVGAIGGGLVFVWFGQAGAGFVTGPWITIDATLMIALIGMAASLLIGSIGTAYAYGNAPSATIGVFDIGYLGFTVLWGVIVFHEIPDMWTMIGVIGLACAGIIAVRS